MPEPLWIYLMALLYFTNITTCSAISDTFDLAYGSRKSTLVQLSKTSRYCWRIYFKVLEVLFFCMFPKRFCLQRRHVGYTNFGTFEFANSIVSLLGQFIGTVLGL